MANVYHLLARKPKSSPERVFYLSVMTLAGSSVLIDNATRSFRRKDCSSIAYLFAIGLTAYLAFALGCLLIVLQRHL